MAESAPVTAASQPVEGELLVCALLLNYRGVAMTLQCVRDLLAVENVGLRVVVLDNASGADEVAELQAGVAALDARQHTVRVVCLDDNLGFAEGMNRGIALAQKESIPYVLVLNNDMRLPKDFVRPLVDVLQNDASVGAVGPTIIHPDGSVWAEGGEIAFVPNGLRLIRHGKQPSALTAGPEEVEFLTGACMMMRTAAANDVGGFDRDYFMYWEDVEISCKLRRRGLRIIWLPWVRVEHLGGQSSGGGRSPLRKFFMACNAVRYLRAHGSLKAWVGWILLDVMLWPLTLLVGSKSAWAKLRGTLAGLFGHTANAQDVVRFLGKDSR